MITCDRWRELSTLEIMQSVELALRVLRERELSKEDVKFLLSLASEMGEVAANCIR